MLPDGSFTQYKEVAFICKVPGINHDRFMLASKEEYEFFLVQFAVICHSNPASLGNPQFAVSAAPVGVPSEI